MGASVVSAQSAAGKVSGPRWKETWDDDTEYAELPQEVQVPRRMSFAPEVLRGTATNRTETDQGPALLARPPGWTRPDMNCVPAEELEVEQARAHMDKWDVGAFRLNQFDSRDTAQRHADALCGGCPVIELCLEAAMSEEEGQAHQYRHLIRGGLTPRARWELEQARQGSVA